MRVMISFLFSIYKNFYTQKVFSLTLILSLFICGCVTQKKDLESEYLKCLDIYDTKDYSSAAKCFADKCKLGSMKACTDLGVMYNHNPLFNDKKGFALDLYKDACDHNYMRGCYYAGINSYPEKSVEKNFLRAKEYLEKACNGKYYQGCYSLVNLFLRGDLQLKDLKQDEIFLFTKAACNENSSKGCYYLGICYINGIGAPVNIGEGVEIHNNLCNKKIVPSCMYLGEMYQNGFNVQQDNKVAKEYFDKADKYERK